MLLTPRPRADVGHRTGRGTSHLKAIAWLLGGLLLAGGLAGPGREATDYAVWWLTNTQPPELALSGPPGAVRGTLEIPIQTLPSGRVDVVGADVDGRELLPDHSLSVETADLPDGEHILTVRAEDRSLWRNTASAALRFSSDNTPPTFDIQPEPNDVPQGHTAVIYVQPSEPADARASFAGAPVRLFGAGQSYWAVIGVDSSDTPGPREVVVEGRDRVGNLGRSEARLAVAPFTFPQDRIQIPEVMLPLLAPSVRAAEDERLLPVYQRDNGPPLWKGPFLLPVIGPVSTEFGEVRSYNGGPFQSHHNGTDFQAGPGAPVQAPAPGRVALREELRLRGRILILDHGGGVYTTYAHLSEWLVDSGENVQPGQPIAKVGSSGLSTGPHLHWELWVSGKAVDPMEWTRREVP